MSRTNEICKMLLNWLDAVRPDDHGRPDKLLNEAPTIDSRPVTEQELGRAIDRAESRGMLTTTAAGFGGGLPSFADLSALGHECVEDHGGDMDAFAEAQRGPSGSVTYSTITMGNHGQASAFNSGGVSQTSITQITTDPGRLRDVANAAEEILPLLPEHTHDEIRAAAQEIRDVAETPDDESKLRAAGARLVAVLGPAAGLFTIARFVIDALSGGLGG